MDLFLFAVDIWSVTGEGFQNTKWLAVLYQCLEPLSFEGNVRENWRKWKQEFELYLAAAESDEKSEKVKSSILLTCIGKRAREIYNTFSFQTEEDKMKVSPILYK